MSEETYTLVLYEQIPERGLIDSTSPLLQHVESFRRFVLGYFNGVEIV